MSSSSPSVSRRAFALGVSFAVLFTALATASLLPSAETSGESATKAAARETLRWRLPVAFGTQLPALGDNILTVRDALAEGSAGALTLEVFEPGEIVSAFAITEAVRLDKVPAGYTWLGYDQGRTPAAPLFGAVPFGLSPWAYLAWWYEGDGERLAQEIYHDQGLHPILCGLIGPETAGWFRKPIDTAEDLEGLKIRFAGLGGKTLQALGASVTMIPGSDLFQALEKGAIDATEYSLPVVDDKLGFPRVAPINYFPGWHQPFTAFHLVVNLQRWNGLAPATQSALETACTAGVTRNLARSEGLQGAVLERFQREGVDTRVLDPALLETLRTAAQAVLEAEAAADPTFARVYANQQRFAERYAVWDALAYPPQRGAVSALPHTRLSQAVDSFLQRLGRAAAWLWLALLAVIVLNVTLRYVFGQGRVELEELQWHLYALGFLLALAVGLTLDDHVRVDVLHARLPLRHRAWIEFYGILGLLLPFLLLVLVYSGPFLAESWRTGEISQAPGGLPFRWLIKGALPLGFALLLLAGLARLSRCCALLFAWPRALPDSSAEGNS